MSAQVAGDDRAPPPGGRAPGHEGQPRGSAAEVFAVALGLGLTSFGGPIAHLGYFERTYVQRRRWLSADDYAGIVALCQMAPGPASSQVGFLIGLRRAGWAGALAAWLGFTLPSALLMLSFALLAPRLTGPLTEAGLHGLKLVAVAVVAQAVWSMGRRLCPDRQRTALALIAATLLLVIGGPLIQLLALIVGAVGGMLLCRDVAGAAAPPRLPVGRRTGIAAGTLFLLLLVVLPFAGHVSPHSLSGISTIFYKAGALVFGGGHVVLPLLRDALVPAWLSDNVFLSGYGAAQAMPGPLFTVAAYLGAMVAPPGSGLGATALWSTAALVFLFLPGLLVALAGLPLWNWIGGHPAARGGLAGVSAAVVGVLGAALYNPIWTSAILGARDLAIALIGFILLERWKAPPILIVAFCVAAALATAGVH
ncbi:chromate efflux transporter [Sphingomonas azotifigens]|uniref:chromate efflux transporter n=1 Tax=Sphingomonas azotifigens TaxID=330920 RepID=UPI0009FBB5B6|nr:chromate efflux transporter [Sphingomonas azotifigens]